MRLHTTAQLSSSGAGVSPASLFPAAFFTVVYPGIEAYFPDFLRAMARQTRKDGVTLVIVNDGYTQLDKQLAEVSGLPTVQVIACSGTMSGVRRHALRLLWEEGFRAIIFGDADDTFEKHRVEEVLRYLGTHDIVVNDLTLVDVHGKVQIPRYLSARLRHEQTISLSSIVACNMFGLTNTAVRFPIFQELPIDEDIIAVDWLWFTIALAAGATAMFCGTTESQYRQHAGNIAGLGCATPESVWRGVRAKTAHYRACSRVLPGFTDLAATWTAFSDRLAADPAFRQQYLATISARPADFPFWWETIDIPKDENHAPDT